MLAKISAKSLQNQIPNLDGNILELGGDSPAWEGG